MISPDVAAAVTRLRREGVLSADQTVLFGRVARGELVSLSPAIQALLYIGVVALTTGVGVLFKDRLIDFGPASIATAVGACSLACLAWAGWASKPFSRAETASPNIAFDSILVLGALLAAADLAYVEAQFSPLGAAWAWHLLLVSVFYAALAFRFDSRALFSLALTTFAAWRGVAATSVERSLFGFFRDTDAVRFNALVCGLLFVALGAFLVRSSFKAHFEPVAAHLGFLLVLQSIAWGLWDGGGVFKIVHRLTLFGVGTSLGWLAWKARRFALFVFGVLAAYLGMIVIALEIWDELSGLSGRVRELGAFSLIAASSVGLVITLFVLHRRFRREAEE